jgi:hypothetical protein
MRVKMDAIAAERAEVARGRACVFMVGDVSTARAEARRTKHRAFGRRAIVNRNARSVARNITWYRARREPCPRLRCVRCSANIASVATGFYEDPNIASYPCDEPKAKSLEALEER